MSSSHSSGHSSGGLGDSKYKQLHHQQEQQHYSRSSGVPHQHQHRPGPEVLFQQQQRQAAAAAAGQQQQQRQAGQERWVAQAETVDGQRVSVDQLQMRRQVLKEQLLQVYAKFQEADAAGREVSEKEFRLYKAMRQEYKEVKRLLGEV